MSVKRCLLVLVVLVGCKKASKKYEDAAPAPVTPADATAMTVADAPPPDAAAAARTPPDAPPGALVAREDGVGPLNEDSAISVKALEAAFPGHDVKAVSIDQGGDLREEYVGISKGGTLLLKVVGDGSPNSIEIVSNQVWNPFGVAVGMTYAEVEKIVGTLGCADAGEHTDWKSQVAECGTEKIKRYGFDFVVEGESAKDVIAKPELLATAKLVALRWEAPGSGPPGFE
jgi:hypothetical protein